MLSFMTSLHRKELLLSGSEESVLVQSQVCVRVCAVCMVRWWRPVQEERKRNGEERKKMKGVVGSLRRK